MADSAPQTIFCSYSSADESFRGELEDHLSVLKRAGIIETWSFRQIDAGDDWKRRIDERLNASSVILLLVSAYFLGSDYCWNVEMKRALERHDSGEATVIPIILRDCDWHAAPFARLQALPEGAKAVTRWRPRDRAWSNVVAGIRKVVQSKPVTQHAVSGNVNQPVPADGPLPVTLPPTPPHAISFAHVPKQPGPWFHLVSASYSANQLDFAVQNEGAPVIVLDFQAATQGCRVNSWHPSTLPAKEVFRAPTTLESPNTPECTYDMKIRDSSGAERLYRLTLNRRESAARLDFREVG